MKFSKKFLAIITTVAVITSTWTFITPVQAYTVGLVADDTTSPVAFRNAAEYLCTNGTMSPALRAAIHAGNKTFTFAPGKYNIEGQSRDFFVDDNQNGRDTGIGSNTTIQGAAGYEVVQPANWQDMMVPDYTTHAVFETRTALASTTMAGNSNIGHFGTSRGVSNVHIKNVEFVGYIDIRLYSASDSSVENVLIQNYFGTYPNGTWCNSGYQMATGAIWLFGNCTNIDVLNCNMQCTSHHGFTITTGSPSWWAKDITIDECRALHCGSGQLRGNPVEDPNCFATAAAAVPETSGYGYRDWSVGFDFCENNSIDGVWVTDCYALDAWKVGFYTEPKDTGGIVKNLSLKRCVSIDAGQRAVLRDAQGNPVTPRTTKVKETEGCNFYFQGGYFEDCISINGEKSGWLVTGERDNTANPDGDCVTKLVRCGDRGSPRSIADEMMGGSNVHSDGFMAILPQKEAMELCGQTNIVFTNSTILMSSLNYTPFKLCSMQRQQLTESREPDNQAQVAPNGKYATLPNFSAHNCNLTGSIYGFYTGGNLAVIRHNTYTNTYWNGTDTWNGTSVPTASVVVGGLTRESGTIDPDDYIPIPPGPGNSPAPSPSPSVTPTVTATPTASPTPTATPVENPIPTAWAAKYPDWHDQGHFLGSTNTGSQTINFDITPQGTNIDSQVAYVDSSTVLQGTGYDDLAIQVRLNNISSYFDVRNGASFTKTNTVNYANGTKYHVRIVANMTAGTYSVWVTPNGGSETQIASNYAFRSSAPTTNDLGRVYFISSDNVSNMYKVENHVVGANQPQAPPTGLGTVTPNTQYNNNGKITGTTTLMEYKVVGGGSYSTCMATETTGLASGNYVVRYKAKTGYDPSPDTPVTIPNQNQTAPSGLGTVTPNTQYNNNGKITGTTTLMEYKLAASGNYAACSATETTGLASGDYVVRYAARAGFNVSSTTPVTIPNQNQNAPTNLTGFDPTSIVQNDGRITGTTTLMEYKASSASTYIACTGTSILNLTPGIYNVRYAARPGFNVSADASPITINAFIPPTGPDIYYSSDELTFAEHSYSMGSTNTGKRHVEFDVTPAGNNIDGSVDFADTSTTVTSFDDLAIQVRFNQSGGFFEARNGGAFEHIGNAVSYTRDVKYRIEIYADMNAHTYSVFVTPPGGSRTQIATNYAFRTSAPSTNDIGQMFVVAAQTYQLIKVENLKISAKYDSYNTATWTSNGINLGSTNTGTRTVNFDVAPTASGIDASIQYVDTTGTVSSFNNLAMAIRFNPSGYFDVRNGGSWTKAATVNFTGGNVYHVRMVTNLTNSTYSVWITPYGGSETQIASNYAFRTGCLATNDLGRMYLISEASNGLFSLFNHVIT